MTRTFRPFLRALRSLLPKPRRFRQTRARVDAPGVGLGAVEWVLARPLYRFQRFETGNLPRAQRLQGVALQVRQASPYAETGALVAPVEGAALAWIWDAQRVRAALEERGLQADAVRIVPETLLRVPQRDGAVLVRALDGLEGQVWKGGLLAASRWWAESPMERDWLAFQRDAGLDPALQSAQVPAALEMPLGDEPWIDAADVRRATRGGAAAERWIVAACAFALVVTTSWYAVSWLKLREARETREAQLRALERDAEPVLAARGQALDAAGRIDVLRSLAPWPDPLSLMAAVAERTAGAGQFAEWEFRDGRVRVTLAASAAAASSDYVKALESSGLFRNVQAAPSPDGKGLVLAMDVVPVAAPSAPAGRAS